MIKKIPCRIIASASLNNRNELLLRNTNHPPEVHDTGVLLTYSNSLQMVREPVADGLTGRILDCYI